MEKKNPMPENNSNRNTLGQLEKELQTLQKKNEKTPENIKEIKRLTQSIDTLTMSKAEGGARRKRRNTRKKQSRRKK